MRGFETRRTSQPHCVLAAVSLVQALEPRTLLAAVQPDLILLPQAAGVSTTVQGYTPAQIRSAYGFGSIELEGGAAADGAGQTIAIVDAYSDPRIKHDLAAFGAEFDLPAANLKVVNQSGGGALPAVNAEWAGEISLDVEWAHAIAPGAGILLVEARSDQLSDLLAGVKYIRTVPDVSTVSMSWGGSEFFIWGEGVETNSQLQRDEDFTTPPGHQGITFVAAAGDTGDHLGVQWPASSPNVVSVGGTTLTLNGDGSYDRESGWTGTSGGDSRVESRPAYQSPVNQGFTRSVPDVGYDADPSTGFAIYDSVSEDGVSGWRTAGGTSAGAPQWAALIAIADQGRVLQGKTTLDGPSQTLPDLYALYSPPVPEGSNDPTQSAAYGAYANYFNVAQTQDFATLISDGHITILQEPAQTGYDNFSGLGTPRAANLVGALEGDSGTLSGAASGAGESVAAPASPVSIGFVTQPSSVASLGAAASVEVELTNLKTSAFKGPVTVVLFASRNGLLSAQDSLITTVTLKSVSLNAQSTTTYNLKFDYPQTLSADDYDLIATLQVPETTLAAAEAATPDAVMLAAPTADLATSFGNASVVTVQPGKSTSVLVDIENLGNEAVAGRLDLSLYASASGLIDSESTLVTASDNRKIEIAAGKALRIHLSFKAPSGRIAGSYRLIASAEAVTSPTESDLANNVASIATAGKR